MTVTEILNTQLAKDLLKEAENNMAHFSTILGDIAKSILLKRGVSLDEAATFCNTLISHFVKSHEKELKCIIG